MQTSYSFWLFPASAVAVVALAAAEVLLSSCRRRCLLAAEVAAAATAASATGEWTLKEALLLPSEAEERIAAYRV